MKPGKDRGPLSPVGQRKSNRTVLDGVGLLLLSLAVRIVWLRFGTWLQYDSAEYLKLGRNLAQFGAFSLGENGTPPTAIRPPLLPAMIAAFSGFTAEPVFPVLVTNVLLGSVTVVLTYLVARDRFDRRTAIVASLLLAFAPMTCLFTVTVLTESVFTFLVVLGVFLWGRSKLIGAGAAFGLAALSRASILPFLAAIPFLAILPGWRRHGRNHLVILLIALAVCSVWMVRNGAVFGRFIPVASSGWGLNLLCGTLETDTGGRVWNGEAWAPLDFKTNPITRVEDVTDEFAVDNIRMKRALARIADSPLEWIVARFKQYPKLFIDNGDYLLGSSNLPLGEAFAAGRWTVVATKLCFIGVNLVIMMLAMVGLWSLRSSFPDYGHIILFPAFGVLVHLPMWIEPRYLLPMMPMIFVLAAVGIQRIRAHFLAGRVQS